ELRRQLFGRYPSRRSHSRSRSCSPHRHRSYEELSYGGRGYDIRSSGRGIRRTRSRSPGRRKGR
ncbi:hypothetical protein MKW92_016047, partial [Papaver armeniacum]